MATNNKSRDSRRRQRLWCTAKEQIKADGTAEYNAKISPTHDASDYEHKEEEVGEDSMTYLKSVIKTYQEKMGEDSTTYLKSVIKSSPWMAARQRRDLALCEVTDFFKIAAEAIPEVEAKFPADEDYTDEQMQEDMIKRTNTPLVPWFQGRCMYVCYLVRGGPSSFAFFSRKSVGSRKFFGPKGQNKFLGR